MRGSRLLLVIVFGAVCLLSFLWGRELFFGVRKIASFAQCADVQALRAENEALRERMIAGNAPPAALASLLKAPVYANYPFNNYTALVVALGSEEGVHVGMPATLGGEVLVGWVSDAVKHRSTVKTVVSPDVQMPVRVGSRKVPGLFVGGPSPRITMISANDTIAVNDRIISASKELPYGLFIGTIASVAPGDQGGVFQEASVAFPYAFHGLLVLDLMVWIPD